MQETNFLIEILIFDDASTDGTKQIVEQYALKDSRIVTFLQEENQWSKNIKGFSDFLLPAAKGQYIAICEGDDYWNNPLKLQKQVDFLERHLDVGLVFTERSNYFQTLNKFQHPKLSTQYDYIKYNFYDVFFTTNVQIATLTTVFRKELVNELLKINLENPNKLSMFDFCFWTYLSYKSEAALLNINSAVYRVLDNSLSHGDAKVKWNLKKKYYLDFLFYKSILSGIDSSLFEISEYERVKFYYVLALEAEDFEICKRFKSIFLKNRDYYRFSALLLVLNFHFLKKIPGILEKIIYLIKR